ITPVDVSLTAQAYTSPPFSARGTGRVLKPDLRTLGSSRNGAAVTALANLLLNSPLTRCWLRWLTSPNVAASKNAVDPPTPRTTSYPSGTANNSARPSCTLPTSFLTGGWRCDVPMSVVPVLASASSASERTLDGPEPKRPSPGCNSVGICMTSSVSIDPLVRAARRSVRFRYGHRYHRCPLG